MAARKLKILSKIQAFLWLVQKKNAKLTWGNLQRRRWIGLRRCVLCCAIEETMQHLFIEYPYTISIWQGVTDINGEGEIYEMIVIWKKYIKKKKNRNEAIITASLLWHIGLERNCCIFSSKITALSCICHKITNGVELSIGQRSHYRKR